MPGRREDAKGPASREDVGMRNAGRATSLHPVGSAMEAQVNVRKHAWAHRVQVRLVDVNHGWHVQIDDDGDGFEPSNGGSVPGHLGLTALRKRAQVAGGWWKIESRPWLGNQHLLLATRRPARAEFMLARLS